MGSVCVKNKVLLVLAVYFYLDIFSVRMFTVEESLYSASKAFDSYIECLGFWQCVAAY